MRSSNSGSVSRPSPSAVLSQPTTRSRSASDSRRSRLGGTRSPVTEQESTGQIYRPSVIGQNVRSWRCPESAVSVDRTLKLFHKTVSRGYGDADLPGYEDPVWPQELAVSVQPATFRGFANPVDPTTAELRAWAYHPDPTLLQTMPQDWVLLGAGHGLLEPLSELARARGCPARRFALHCMYIYAADGIRTNFRAHPRRRLRKFVENAEHDGDEMPIVWAHNVRMLL